MLRDPPNYDAACTYVVGSQLPEVQLLIDWLDVPIPRIVAVFPSRGSQKDTDVGEALRRAGVSLYSIKDHGWGSNAAILGLWLDDEQLGKIELSRPARVAVAAWQPANIDIWRLAREPVELSGAQLPDRAVLDPVVPVAMDSVAMMSNPANGLTGYSRAGAVEAFRVLRRNGYTWDPIETAVVMARSGWDLDDARAFARLSVDMLAGKGLQGGGQFRSDIIRVWRKKASEASRI